MDGLPIVYLARHGDTTWTASGQHTRRTDLPLTEQGERNARNLRERLHGLTFTKMLASPLQRVIWTCELAGFDARCREERFRNRVHRGEKRPGGVRLRVRGGVRSAHRGVQ